MRAWLLILGACYAPHPPYLVPCSTPGDRCPADQACIDHVCQPDDLIGGDAGTGDGSPDDPDRDRDGIANAADNCPDKPNSDQANEDGDKHGDVCDSCPPFANDAPVDPDGDGVTDLCDPNPATPGDRIVMFEGFHAGVPPGWSANGAWVPIADSLQVTGDGGDSAWLVPPITQDPTSTTSAGFVPTSADGIIRGIGVAAPTTAGFSDGVACVAFFKLNGSERRIGLVDVSDAGVVGDKPLTWIDNEPYVAIETRTQNNYKCTVVDKAGVATTANGPFNNPPSPAKIAVASRGISGRYLWMMYVDSP